MLVILLLVYYWRLVVLGVWFACEDVVLVRARGCVGCLRIV